MKDDQSPQQLYEQAMHHNWRHAESPSHAALARALLERSAAGHHAKALRELAELMFVGAGGPKEPERALALKWAAFKSGEMEALEELSALLGSYSEDSINPSDRKRSELAAAKAEEAHALITWIETYIVETARYAHLSIGQA